MHSGYETGQVLSEALKCNFDEIKIVKGLRKRTRHRENDILIRWGSSAYREKDELFGEVLNTGSDIVRNTNKFNTLKVFKNHDLNVPKLFTDKYRIDVFPVLGRDTYHHGGSDIVMIRGRRSLRRNNFDAIPDKDFYVEFIPSREEYRVHVFKDRIIRVTRKVFRGYNRDNEEVEQEGEIKNDRYGWGHQNVAIENLRDEYGKSCIEAVKAVNLDFGAVDLLISSSGNKPYPLEVNSCPRLNSIGIPIYVNAISSYLQGSNKRYFWPVVDHSPWR